MPGGNCAPGERALPFEYRLLEGLLERIYGDAVTLTYRSVSPAEHGALPLVLVDGEVISSGGVFPRQVVEYLKQIGVPRVAGKASREL